ncbi:uncharacterized protein LOC142635177 [Castanea sativa]|uniref:uncharacterized protein LOC142635177 n=1 Tax=Castanea sativa TaxID=21020 RepID=UPI003F654721
MWHQRSQIQWLKSGDKNTKFFHGSATQRKRKNFVKGLEDDNGVWHEDDNTFSSLLNEYYSKLFCSSIPHDFECILDGVDVVVIEEMRIDFARPYTSKEVDVAIKDIAPLKALGPDAFESLHHMKTNCTRSKSFMALKLDMSKAYDRVDLLFHSCKWGIEGFDFTFKGIEAGSSLEECHKIQTLLDYYEMASGQMINNEKTTLFFSKNTNAQTQNAIKEAPNVPAIQHYEKYLGLPSFIGIEKKAVLPM